MRKIVQAIAGAVMALILGAALVPSAANAAEASGPRLLSASEVQARDIHMQACGGAGRAPIAVSTDIVSQTSVLGYRGAKMIYDIWLNNNSFVATQILWFDDQNRAQWFQIPALSRSYPHAVWVAPWGNNLANPKIRVQTGPAEWAWGDVSFTCGITS